MVSQYFDLLDLIDYVPSERYQGHCGNCGSGQVTGVMDNRPKPAKQEEKTDYPSNTSTPTIIEGVGEVGLVVVEIWIIRQAFTPIKE